MNFLKKILYLFPQKIQHTAGSSYEPPVGNKVMAGCEVASLSGAQGSRHQAGPYT